MTPTRVAAAPCARGACPGRPAGPAVLAAPWLVSIALSLSALWPVRATAQVDPDASRQTYEHAVSALRDGRTREAARLLEELTERMPAHAGAWLDLGIALCELGRRTEAERVFSHIEAAFAPGPAIREIVGHYRASGCHPRPPAAPVAETEFRAGVGYASNVNQGVSDLTVRYGAPGQSVLLTLTDDFRPRGAAFAAGDVFHRRALGEAGRWKWDSGVRLRAHGGLGAYDTVLAFTGLLREWQAQSWRGNFHASGSGLWLGGRSYQRGAGGGVVAWRPLAAGWSFGLDLESFAYRYPELSRYDNTSTAASGKLRRFGKDWQLTVAAGWITDLAPERPGGRRQGFSASARGQWRLSGDLGLDALIAWRRLDEQAPYNPLLWEAAIREQRQFQGQVALEHRLGPDDALRLELNRLVTRDTLPIFAFSGTSLGLTWVRVLRAR